MLLAGLGIDVRALSKVYAVILRLTFIPTAVEVIAIAVLAMLVLHMPWLWAILLG